MDITEQKEIRLVVEDEKTLYSSFSPEAEFSEPVKAYIRSRMAVGNYRQRVDLTVISREPVDEERFRTAVSNWIGFEKAAFRKRWRDTLIMEMPVIRVERWFFKKIAENSVISFEYGQEDADSLQISAAK